MLRTHSNLPLETETLITRVIGCCIEVHRALGPGLLERICSRAVCIELGHNGIPYEREKQIPVKYRGQFLCNQWLDIVVANVLILEIKCVEKINPVHHAQLLNYLHIAQLRAGLLINFNVAMLQDGIKRMVL